MVNAGARRAKPSENRRSTRRTCGFDSQQCRRVLGRLGSSPSLPSKQDHDMGLKDAEKYFLKIDKKRFYAPISKEAVKKQIKKQVEKEIKDKRVREIIFRVIGE